MEAIRRDGSEVIGMVAIFSYEFPIAATNFKKEKVSLTTLTNYETVLSEALRIDYIAESELETLKEWRHSPETWPKKK